jgi:hypothetical protein
MDRLSTGGPSRIRTCGLRIRRPTYSDGHEGKPEAGDGSGGLEHAQSVTIWSRWAVLLALVLVSTSARAQEWKAPAPVEIAMQGTAVALIWVDVVQTLRFTARGEAEWNPLLGAHPRPSRVVLVGGVLPTVALTAAWLLLPQGWRDLLPAAVIGIEVDAVTSNAGLVLRF